MDGLFTFDSPWHLNVAEGGQFVTAADVAYRWALRLAGEFFNPSSLTSVLDPSYYMLWLRAFMQHICAVSPYLTQPQSKVVDGCQLLHIYSSNMTLYLNNSSLLMIDLTKCSNAQKKFNSLLKVVMPLSQLFASSLHTLITNFHISYYWLQLQSLHLLE